MNQENNNLDNQLNEEQLTPEQPTEPMVEEVPMEQEVEEVPVEPEVSGEVSGTEQPKDLETYFKEHRNNGEHYEVRRFGGLIVFLALVALALGGYILFDEKLKIEEPTNSNPVEEKKEEETPEVQKDNNFEYTYYDLKLPKVIDSPKDIYYIYVKTEDYVTYELYGKYTSEKEVLLANIKCKDKVALDYRVLESHDNKLYFVIHSKENGDVFEVNYIDFTDLTLGAKKLDDFNEIYKKDNLFVVNKVNTYYPSYLYVKENTIFYTSYVEKSLKKYDLKAKKSETLIKNVSWSDFFVDKRNNNIFYLDKNNKLNVTNLDGKDPVQLKNAKYGGSTFWLRAYYNNKPVFGFDNNSIDTIDIYAYDYKTKDFIEIEKNANASNIKYNNIDMKATSDAKIPGYLYIG